MTRIVTVQYTSPEMKIEINPRGNGIEWEKYIDGVGPGTTLQKVYIPIIDGLQLGVVYNEKHSHVTILVDPITNKPFPLSEDDAERVYKYIAELIDQWHPNALESGGYVHPALRAAQHNYTLETVALKPLVTGGGGAGGGSSSSSSSSSNRKSRKSRKSMKSRAGRKRRRPRIG